MPSTPKPDDVEDYWEHVPRAPEEMFQEMEEREQELFREGFGDQAGQVGFEGVPGRSTYPFVPPDIQRRAMALLGFPTPLEPPQVSPDIQLFAVERIREELSYEDAMTLFPPPEESRGAGQSVTSLATPQIASFLGLENPPEDPIQSGTSEGAPWAGYENRLTAEMQREFHHSELVRVLNSLGIAAGVREYTNNGVRTLYLTIRGDPVLGSQPYNLSVSPTSEEGLILAVQFE